MGKSSGTVQQTGAQAAAQEIGMQQLADFATRWSPILKNFSASVLKAAAPGSAERVRATAMSGIDNSVRFGKAAEAGVAEAARTGTTGSAKQKLGITSLGDAQATTTGFQSVDADQRVDDASVQGLSAVARAGRSSGDAALSGLNRNAAMSGRVAENDARMSLERDMGTASLASKIIGTGAGLWMGSKAGGGGIGADTLVNDGFAPADFLKYGTSGD